MKQWKYMHNIDDCGILSSEKLISTNNLLPYLAQATVAVLGVPRFLEILQIFLYQVWQCRHESICHQLSEKRKKKNYDYKIIILRFFLKKKAALKSKSKL